MLDLRAFRCVRELPSGRDIRGRFTRATGPESRSPRGASISGSIRVERLNQSGGCAAAAETLFREPPPALDANPFLPLGQGASSDSPTPLSTGPQSLTNRLAARTRGAPERARSML